MRKHLGIEIGSYNLKIAVISDGKAEKIVIEPVPENLVRDGVIVSWEAMADCIREALKKNDITTKAAFMALSEKNIYQKRTALPAMTAEQLKVNLPYEFHDYITEDRDKYIYDYVVLGHIKDEDGNIKELDLICVAVLKEVVEKYVRMCKRAGLKLVSLAPGFSAYRRLLFSYGKSAETNINSDYAIVNLGHEAVSILIFTKGVYWVTRYLELGVNDIIGAIADIYNCDSHLAEIYLRSDESVQNREEVIDVCEKISIEIMRLFNFFSFNHPENNLEAIYYCGGGSQISQLVKSIEENLHLPLIPATELEKIATKGFDEEKLMIGIEAIGIGLM